MKLKSSIYFVFLIFLVCFSISCGKEPTEPNTGRIFVKVVDNDVEETPISNVEITITNGNELVQMTDDNGISSFEVNSGNYIVNAKLCCAGPGFIIYREPVTVIENETVDVKLTACLRCL